MDLVEHLTASSCRSVHLEWQLNGKLTGRQMKRFIVMIDIVLSVNEA